MADEESFLEDDVAGGQDVEVGQKGGFLPAFAVRILKWAVIAIAAIIFIVTVVIITTRILNQGTRSGSVAIDSSAYTQKIPKYSWFDSFEDIRTRTGDDTAYTVIARVALGYDENNKKIQAEIVTRSRLLQDRIRSYFSKHLAAELHPKHEDRIKADLLEEINSIITDGKIGVVLLLEYNLIEM